MFCSFLNLLGRIEVLDHTFETWPILFLISFLHSFLFLVTVGLTKVDIIVGITFVPIPFLFYFLFLVTVGPTKVDNFAITLLESPYVWY